MRNSAVDNELPATRSNLLMSDPEIARLYSQTEALVAKSLHLLARIEQTLVDNLSPYWSE